MEKKTSTPTQQSSAEATRDNVTAMVQAAENAYQGFMQSRIDARNAIGSALERLVKSKPDNTLTFDPAYCQPVALCINGCSDNAAYEPIKCVRIDEDGDVQIETEYGTYCTDDIIDAGDLYDILTAGLDY